MLTKCELINQLLIKGHDMYYTCFNNIMDSLMMCCLHLVVCTRAYLYELVKAEGDLPLVDCVIGLEGTASYQQGTTLLCKKGSELSQER